MARVRKETSDAREECPFHVEIRIFGEPSQLQVSKEGGLGLNCHCGGACRPLLQAEGDHISTYLHYLHT